MTSFMNYHPICAVPLSHTALCTRAAIFVRGFCLIYLTSVKVFITLHFNMPGCCTIFLIFNTQTNSFLETTPFSMSSLLTASTDTSASTEQGLGTIFGRGLMIFGEAAKDALDNIVIRRKLVVFKSVFRHTDGQDHTISQQDYTDLIELCR